MSNLPLQVPDLDLNGGSHKLFEDRPDASQVHGSLPRIQNGHHFADSFQVVFEDVLKVVTPRSGLLYNDAELVVDEEANVEIARPHQTVSKHLQRALHLQQSILFLDLAKGECLDVHASVLATLKFEPKNKQRNGRYINHKAIHMQVRITSKSFL